MQEVFLLLYQDIEKSLQFRVNIKLNISNVRKTVLLSVEKINNGFGKGVEVVDSTEMLYCWSKISFST